MRAIRRDALDKRELKTSGMEFASEMMIEAARKNLRIKEVPITYYPRSSPSKLHSFGDGWRHLRFIHHRLSNDSYGDIHEGIRYCAVGAKTRVS
jgi:hypothetical protein